MIHGQCMFTYSNSERCDKFEALIEHQNNRHYCKLHSREVNVINHQRILDFVDSFLLHIGYTQKYSYTYDELKSALYLFANKKELK